MGVLRRSTDGVDLRRRGSRLGVGDGWFNPGYSLGLRPYPHHLGGEVDGVPSRVRRLWFDSFITVKEERGREKWGKGRCLFNSCTGPGPPRLVLSPLLLFRKLS